MGGLDPPDPFITLNEATKSSEFSQYAVIGVCVDFLPAVKSRGPDFTIKFVLYDPLWNTERHDRGMQFRFFHKSIDHLPAIQSTGDVLILRNVRNKNLNGWVGISNSTTSWVVLSGSSILDSTCPNGSDISFTTSEHGLRKTPPPSEAELQYAKHISVHTDPSSYREAKKSTSLQIESIILESGGTPAPRANKWRLLTDMKLSKSNSGKFADGRPSFADLFGEIRKVYTRDYAKVELYLTDYTSNPRLYNYNCNPEQRDGDEHGYIDNHASWHGPWGRMTIKVFCWDAHADFARIHVKEGSYALIKNCNIKEDPNGTLLEAVCRGDREDLSKVNITLYQPHEADREERLKHLLQRKRDYEKSAVKQGWPLGKATDSNSKKRSVEQVVGATKLGDDAPETSKSKKRKRKQRAKKDKTANADDIVPPTAKSIQSNQYVRCLNINVPVKSIDSILDPEILKRTTQAGNDYRMPFQNCTYKVKVRVVDYFPHNLADFAVPCQSSEYEMLSDNESDDDHNTLIAQAQSNPDSVNWEWRFMLIVEDGTSRPPNPDSPRKQMPLLVAEKDAEYLIPLHACDLRRNPEELARLKETMFVLWGDLQERKEESQDSKTNAPIKPQSNPFECFVKEYGVPIGKGDRNDLEYQRMFRLWGATC